MQSQEMDVQRKIVPSTEMTPQELPSPTKTPAKPKLVSFDLYLPHTTERSKARLSMRVNIFPHDTTESIITTVKNFYGLYEVKGIIFEDRDGNMLIGRYENFPSNGVVHVRVAEETPEYVEFTQRHSMSPRRLLLENGLQKFPPPVKGRQASRPNSRTAPQRSHSPQPGRGRRSASASTNNKHRTRPVTKSRGTSSHGGVAEINGDAQYHSDSDGGDASVTSSRRGKMEQLASADISVENIVEGGRRKRAKFSSFELPLFVPPQVPQAASLSSTSPQRRISNQNDASPYVNPAQQTFAYPHPIQSPQKQENGDTHYLQGLATPFTTSTGPVGSTSYARAAARYAPSRQHGSNGAIILTPEMTHGSASVMSDEDVALQLMRLGDASNMSTRARTSTSTLDDSMSGKAEADSSLESDDNMTEDHDLPPLPYSAPQESPTRIVDSIPYQSGDFSGEEYEDNQDVSFKGESDELVPEDDHDARARPVGSKGRSSHSTTKTDKTGKTGKSRAQSKSKSKGAARQPLSPTSLPSGSRKASNASLHFHQLAADEEDLSSKPRCQRCRKSKKGCDRQRPCQRCKDAGIGIEGCVSEDEGNGRKGRFGRHMGVPIKKSQMEALAAHEAGGGAPTYSPAAMSTTEKSKKRKR